MITEYPIWSLLYGLSVMWVGISSFLFHASLRWISQKMDVGAIYAMLLYFIALFIFFGLYRSYAQLKRLKILYEYENIVQVVLIILLLLFDVLSFVYKESLDSFTVLPVTFVVLITVNGIWYAYFGKKLLIKSARKKAFRIGVCGTIVFILGFTIRQLDGVVCIHRSFFQMHALFHVFIAIALVIMYIMLRHQKYSAIKHAAVDSQDELVLEADDINEQEMGRIVTVQIE